MVVVGGGFGHCPSDLREGSGTVGTFLDEVLSLPGSHLQSLGGHSPAPSTTSSGVVDDVGKVGVEFLVGALARIG